MKRKLKSRPAESTSLLAGAVAALVAPRVGVTDPSDIAALAIVLGAVPSLVTYVAGLVERARA